MESLYLDKTDEEKMWLDKQLYACYCHTKDGKWVDVTKVRLNENGLLVNLNGKIIEGTIHTTFK